MFGERIEILLDILYTKIAIDFGLINTNYKIWRARL